MDHRRILEDLYHYALMVHQNLMHCGKRKWVPSMIDGEGEYNLLTTSTIMNVTSRATIIHGIMAKATTIQVMVTTKQSVEDEDKGCDGDGEG